jgi:membrane protein insertase Oxa1/YidC/SpoIIIJ
MFYTFWTDFLYQPVFNALIWIYSNWTDASFGWAVVYLTIILRVVLLPFTIIDEASKAKNQALSKEIEGIEKSFQNDPIMRKEEIRRILKKRQVQPWAKAIVLGIQALVLVLLYQVFLRGLTNDKIVKILYPFINFPGTIKTNFYAFDLAARHDWLWAGTVAIWLLVEIYLGYRHRRHGISKSDLAYFLVFPLFVFLLLWWLPMVKSLFILTSILFSVIVGWFIRRLFRTKPAK